MRRCGKCEPCLRPECGKCKNCLVKQKAGKGGIGYRSCQERRCWVVYPGEKPKSAVVRKESLRTSNNSRRTYHSDHKGSSTKDDEVVKSSAPSKDTTSSRPSTSRKPVAPMGSVSKDASLGDLAKKTSDIGRSKRSYSTGTAAGPMNPGSTQGKKKSKTSSSSSPIETPSTEETVMMSTAKTAGPAKQRPSAAATTNTIATGKDRSESTVVASSSSSSFSTTTQIKPCVVSSFSLPPPSSPFLLWKRSKKKRQPTPMAALTWLPSLYGVPVPDRPKARVCAACAGERDNAYDDDDERGQVLLCDGTGCGREYHVGCCGLEEVPKDDVWLCVDCSPMGTTAVLQQYLDATDDARSDFLHDHPDQALQAYVDGLIQKDLVHAQYSPDCIPVSDLTNEAKTRKIKDLLGSAAVWNDNMIGMPVKLRVRDDRIHTGRIVAKRFNHIGHTCVIEYRVRFPAGIDDRKETYYHWIILEEHALAVGIMVVDVLKGSSYLPAIIWLNTARELVGCIKDVGSRLEYRDNNGDPVKGIDPKEAKGGGVGSSKVVGVDSPGRTNPLVLAGPFGVEERVEGKEWFVSLRPRNIRALTTDYEGKKDEDKRVFMYMMAMAELSEQHRVQQWNMTQSGNPYWPTAISSYDYYHLPPLSPFTQHESEANRPKLLANVLMGLDRVKLLEQLQARHGITLDKDEASSMTCKVIPMDLRRFHRELVKVDHMDDTTSPASHMVN